MQQAVSKALENSPEITVISFEPAIAEQQIIQGQSAFDATAFGRFNQNLNKQPPSTSPINETTLSDIRSVEAGLQKKEFNGEEWSASYMLTRSWDNLPSRSPTTRYEPVIAFQLKKPLLRDGVRGVNMADINLAKINHRVSLLGFRRRAEEVATEVIASYWQLYFARHEAEIHRQLLDMARETLTKVEGRREIDATEVQIKQVEASVQTRQALLLQAEKRITDAQDALKRFLADPGMSLLSDTEIQCTTEPRQELIEPESDRILSIAMQENPELQQARLSLEVTELNIKVANNQRMPRLDFLASTSTRALASTRGQAHDGISDSGYISWGVGLSMEIPIGNRNLEAELQRRRLEHQKAISQLHTIADRVAVQTKGYLRQVQTSFEEIAIHQHAMDAANMHLQALEESEAVRQQLTPEFLLVKLQGQEMLVNARRSHTQAIVNYNIALAELAHTTGTILRLHQVNVPTSQESEIKSQN
jgi:outer membrane protein TolC